MARGVGLGKGSEGGVGRVGGSGSDGLGGEGVQLGGRKGPSLVRVAVQVFPSQSTWMPKVSAKKRKGTNVRSAPATLTNRAPTPSGKGCSIPFTHAVSAPRVRRI